MIRQFQFRDTGLVRRLGEQGVLLDAEAALTTNPHPLRRALIGRFVGGHYSTFVWGSEEKRARAFAQLRREEGSTSAHVVFLGAEGSLGRKDDPDIDEEVWLPLLEQLVVETGRCGVHNLVAEASETGPELPVLRRSGFAVYTRQDIWIADQIMEDEKADVLRPHEALDDWDIQVLYANIVPGLIQSVEPSPPLDHGQNWVLREKEELAAFVHVRKGTVASWMRLLIHPNAQTMPSDVIRAALSVAEPTPQRPVYCCLRRYQSWLQTPLENAGFRQWGSQAVLVKHIVQHVEPRPVAMQRTMEPQTVPGSSTFVQGFSQIKGNHRKN
jgi:hypothetical protein